jgi:two-component system, response regulator
MAKETRQDHVVEILLVEDNCDDEELTLLTLEENHITNSVKVVRDGVEALEYLFCTGAYAGRNITNRPKLILLDIKLPKVSGLQVLERIKSDERTRKIPVVVLTSSSEGPDIEKSYQLGANSYIVKPVDFAQFKDTIKKLGFYWQILNIPPDR